MLNMDIKNKALNLYFVDKKKQIDIVKELGVSKSTLNDWIKSDERYEIEKLKRKDTNKKKHIENTKRIIRIKRKTIQFSHNVDDLVLKKIHESAARELSKNKRLSNLSYREWNSSAYRYNQNKKRFEFREDELGRSYDVPKYIKLEN